MIQSGGFFGRLLGLLLKPGLPLIKNVIKLLAKSALIHLALTAAALTADAGMHKKLLGSGNITTLFILNNKMEHIIKIIKSLEYSGLLLEEKTETAQNEVKEQKGGFLSMLLGTLGVCLLGNLLTGKGIYRAEKGKGEGIVRAGYGNNSSKMDF